MLTKDIFLHILCLNGGVYMATTNLNIRIDQDIKDQAEEIFNLSGKPVLCYENGKFYR